MKLFMTRSNSYIEIEKNNDNLKNAIFKVFEKSAFTFEFQH